MYRDETENEQVSYVAVDAVARVIRIERLTEEMSGRYLVEASNSVGIASESFALRVQDAECKCAHMQNIETPVNRPVMC